MASTKNNTTGSTGLTPEQGTALVGIAEEIRQRVAEKALGLKGQGVSTVTELSKLLARKNATPATRLKAADALVISLDKGNDQAHALAQKIKDTLGNSTANAAVVAGDESEAALLAVAAEVQAQVAILGLAEDGQNQAKALIGKMLSPVSGRPVRQCADELATLLKGGNAVATKFTTQLVDILQLKLPLPVAATGESPDAKYASLSAQQLCQRALTFMDQVPERDRGKVDTMLKIGAQTDGAPNWEVLIPCLRDADGDLRGIATALTSKVNLAPTIADVAAAKTPAPEEPATVQRPSGEDTQSVFDPGEPLGKVGTVVKVLITTLGRCEPFSNLFPKDEVKQKAIEDSMRAQGYDDSQPIPVWGRTPLDGNSRIAAAEAVGITEVPVYICDFKDLDGALDYAVHLQRDRRQLTDADIFHLAGKLDKVRDRGGDRKSAAFQAKQADEQTKAQGAAIERSSDKTARLIGTSGTKIEHVRAIQAAAKPEVIKKVASGDWTINRAYNAIRSPKPDKYLTPDEKRRESGNLMLRNLKAASEAGRAHWSAEAEQVDAIVNALQALVGAIPTAKPPKKPAKKATKGGKVKKGGNHG